MSLPNISNNAMWFAEKSAAKMGSCVLGQGISLVANYENQCTVSEMGHCSVYQSIKKKVKYISKCGS